MSLTMTEAFDAARAALPLRRAGALDPGILLRADFTEWQVVWPPQQGPSPVPTLVVGRVAALFDFWPKDRQQGQFPWADGSADCFVTLSLSWDQYPIRGQYRLVEREEGIFDDQGTLTGTRRWHLFAPTHPKMRFMETPLESVGAEIHGEAVFGRDLNPKSRVSVRFQVPGVAYLA